MQKQLRFKIIPDGYESANHFFEAVFKDKEMIWMGQNTNELHIGHNEDVHKAMIDCIGSDEYCKYPPPEGFTELQSLILKDLDLEDLSIYVNAGATESLYLAMNAVLFYLLRTMLSHQIQDISLLITLQADLQMK